jgi:hypothetical protein
MTDYSLDLDIGAENVPQTSDDYYTPPWVFEGLGLHFNTDPAQPIGGISWIPVDKYYTILDDGLAQPWEGRVWMNPPFSNSTPWARKFAAHNNGVCLMPTAKAKWFDEMWDAADAIMPLPSRMEFVTSNGDYKGIFMPTVFFAFGEENVEGLKRLGIARVR